MCVRRSFRLKNASMKYTKSIFISRLRVGITGFAVDLDRTHDCISATLVPCCWHCPLSEQTLKVLFGFWSVKILALLFSWIKVVTVVVKLSF